MNIEIAGSKPRARTTGRAPAIPIVDCDLHHSFPSDEVLLSYLDPRWHDHHRTYGARGHQPTKFSTSPYPRSAGGGLRRDAVPPSGQKPGSDYAMVFEQVMDPLAVEAAVLNLGVTVGGQLHEEYDSAFARASNTYTEECWLRRSSRLLASICIPYENATYSVNEIEHWSGNPAFVQAYFRVRTSQPIGRKKYWPIFEAAAHHNITIGMHLGGLSAFPITSAGWPSYYIEDHTLISAAFQSQIISMVCEGVFDRFPKLKLVCMEGGFSWIAPLMWRMDKQWKRLRSEMPHLKRLPSEVIRDHVRVTTQPMEEPHRTGQLLQSIEHLGEDMLMFSTDYPHWDFDHPDRAFQVDLPKELKAKILNGNARALWGLPDRLQRVS